MKRLFSILSGALFLSSTLTAWAAGDRTPSSTSPAIISWQPPATFSMAPTGGRTSYAEIGFGPVPFFPVTPCRQYDSRNTTALANATPRTVTLSGAPCGIPAMTNAIAVNITVFNIAGAGSNGVFKVDTVSPPAIAWINYPSYETQRANAGVVAVSGGALVVQVNQGAGQVDFVVDVFGYYYNGNSAAMPTGDYFGIEGDYSGGGVSYGTRGWASSMGAGSAGVEGESLGATGAVCGVKGLTSSTSAWAAGVLGCRPAVRPRIRTTTSAKMEFSAWLRVLILMGSRACPTRPDTPESSSLRMSPPAMNIPWPTWAIRPLWRDGSMEM